MTQSLAIPRVIPNDWKRLDLIVNKIKMRLGSAGTPTFAGLTSGTLTLSKICLVAAGLNVLRVTGLQTDGVAMTGTLRGAYIDVSNGSTAATGTIRALELKARTEAPGDTGNNVAVLEGLSISADSKAHSVTTMRAAEFILDGKTAGTIDEAVGLRIANNLQIDKATVSYGLQIYRDSFDYTADIDLTPSPAITANGTRIIKFDTTSLNTLVGQEAGNSLTGVNNTFVGYRAGYSATDINNIVLLGHQAGYSLINTSENCRSIFAGYQAGYNVTTGEKNTAMGNQALFSETTGENSIAIGHIAGYNQVGSNACVLVGASAGYYNIDGVQNTYIGTHSGRGAETKSGNYNTGVGYRVLYTIGTTVADEAEYNTAVGYEAGFYLTTGSDNVFVGARAGRDTTTGIRNFALGTHALLENVDGNNNVCVGYEAGKSTDGNSISSNILIGYRAGYVLQGNSNVMIGQETGNDATTLHDSILIGYRAGYNLTTLDDNVMIGRESGFTGTTADACTYLGYQTGYTATTAARRICIGHSAGFYDTNSDRFILDNQKRTNAAEEITNALMYGIMAAAPADQSLRINATLNINGKLTAGSFASPIDVTVGGAYGFEFHYSGNNYDVTGIRSRAQLVTTDTTASAQGAVLQAANNDGIDAGVLNGALIEAIGKSDGNAATIAVMRGCLVNTEWGDYDTVTNLKTLHVRTHSRNAAGAGSFGTGYGIYIENEAVGGNGQAYDAGIYFKGTNLSAGNKAFAYGIDFSGGTYGTAEINLKDTGTIGSSGADLNIAADGTVTIPKTGVFGAADTLGVDLRNVTASVVDTSQSMLLVNSLTAGGSETGGPFGSGFTVLNSAGNQNAFFNFVGSSTNTSIFSGAVDGDDYRRFRITAEGIIRFGSGAVTTDVDLFRGGADRLETSDAFVAGGTITSNSSIWGERFILDNDHAEAVLIRKNGDAGDVFVVDTIAGFVAIGGTGPETLLELTHATPYLTLHNSTHEDTDGGGESRLIFKREDGGTTETACAQIEASHDGVVANDQLGKMIFSVNTGAALVDIVKIDGGGNTYIGDAGITNYTQFAIDGSLTFVGTAGLAYGEISVKDNAVATTLNSGAEVQLTVFDTNGPSNNTAPDQVNNEITITTAGHYLVTISIHINNNAAQTHIVDVSLNKNNGSRVELTNVHGHRTLTGGSGDVGSMSLSGIVDLAVDDELQLWATTDVAADRSVTFEDITLSIIQIGGT